MKKCIGITAAVLLVCVSGCGDNADGLIKQQIQGMNDLAAAMESKAPEAKVKELQQNLEQVGKKLEALKLSDDDKKKLVERHKDELTKAGMRLAKAGMDKAMGDFGKMFGDKMPGMPPGMPKMPEGFPGGGEK